MVGQQVVFQIAKQLRSLGITSSRIHFFDRISIEAYFKSRCWLTDNSYFIKFRRMSGWEWYTGVSRLTPICRYIIAFLPFGYLSHVDTLVLDGWLVDITTFSCTGLLFAHNSPHWFWVVDYRYEIQFLFQGDCGIYYTKEDRMTIQPQFVALIGCHLFQNTMTLKGFQVVLYYTRSWWMSGRVQFTDQTRVTQQ